MKKWLIGLLIVGVVAAFLVPAFGATTAKLTPDKQKEVEQLAQQILDSRTQIIDKYLEAGVITKEDADSAKGSLKKIFEKQKEQGFIPGPQVGSGGCGGSGAGYAPGMMGGNGTGYAPGNSQYAPQNNNI